MRRSCLILVLLLGSLASLRAQLGVEVLLDQDQFLRDESVPLKVRINNLSGQSLTMGKDADEITFSVQSQEGYNVSRLGEIPAQDPYSLPSAKAAIRRIDILPYFDVSRPGRYSVTVTVKIKKWDREFISKPKTFEIISGLKLWEQEFGVPGGKGPPEVRKYILQQANYLKRLTLYLRLSDATDTRVFRVLPIGPLVSFSHPETLLDDQNNLHVLSQTGGWSFIYMVVSPQGAVLIRQRHDYTDTRPVLRATTQGKVVVIGGIRRITAEDIPSPIPEPSTNDAAAPKT